MIFLNLKELLLLDMSCPGDHNPCSGNGTCNLAIGECTCNEGHHTATAINTRIIKCLAFAIVLILILIVVLIYVLVSTIQFNESSKNHILA